MLPPHPHFHASSLGPPLGYRYHQTTILSVEWAILDLTVQFAVAREDGCRGCALLRFAEQVGT